MSMVVNAGAMRDVIAWYELDNDATDDWGRPVGPTQIYSECMANVRVSSGLQNASLGMTVTDEVITVMTWYDPRIKNDMLILWSSNYYLIQHIKPDDLRRGMIITAKVQRNG